MAIAPIVTKGAQSVAMGSKFIFFLRTFFFTLFFAYILVSTIMIGIREKDVTPVIINFGEEFGAPLEDAALIANEAIESEGESLAESSIWEKMEKYFVFYISVYKIYLWYAAILLFIVNPLTKDSNVPIIRLTFATFFFIGVQIIAALLLDKSPNLIFMNIWSIIKAFPYLV